MFRIVQVRPPFHRWLLLTPIAMLPVLISLDLAGDEPAADRRVRPPNWDRVPAGVFFDNAFQEALRGDRPANLGRRTTSALPPQPQNSPNDSPGLTAHVTWPSLVSSATLEDEIKRIDQQLGRAISNEREFQRQGHRDLRPDLGTAAILFAVIDQFDGQVRWKADAAIVRDRFAQLARNAKVGSDAVLREAKQRQLELNDLIRGSRLAAGTRQSATAPASPPDWPSIADRQLIMQRLEASVQNDLAQAVGSEAAFSQHSSTVLREAELVAVLAQVLLQPDMIDADDPDYAEYCHQLRAAASDLRQSVEKQRFDDARQAHGAMRNSCTRCHELYRS